MSNRAKYSLDGRDSVMELSLIEGFPDVGLVGTIATSYLINRLESNNVGYVEIEGLPPIVVVHRSIIYEPCRLYVCKASDKRFGVFHSDVPIPPPSIAKTAESIVEIGGALRAPMLISIGGVPEPERLEIEKPRVFVLSNDKELMERAVGASNSTPFEDGFITGMKAAILKQASKRDFKVLVALAQSHLNYPDPGAAAEIISFLNWFLGIDIPVEPLLQQAEQLKLQLRDLMRRTTSQMVQLPKGLELEQSPMYIR